VGGDSEEHKLYIKSKCSLCLGGVRKGIFVNCPYCDVDRKSFIEAPFSSIKEILEAHLSPTQKKELIKCLTDEKPE
jgi:hypothetical protein